ncbi:hypothetical protein MASR2M117_09710 [Paludibacter sp.]
MKINRFDIDFINVDTNNISENLSTLGHKYPAFFPVFITDVLMMNLDDTLGNTQQISDFLRNKIFIDVNKQVTKELKDVNSIEKELSTAFSYIKHYFPDLKIPDIYFFVSGFNLKSLINDSIIGIGSDLFLGADYQLYGDIAHEYQIPNMRKEMIVSDIINNFLHEKFLFNGEINLLNLMIYEGKIMFLINEFTDLNEDLAIGYSKEELSWCNKHERQIWSSIIEQKHLYTTDYFTVNQYINIAPFTSPISQESPGRLGIWVGWQIVKNYMRNNENISLRDLMQNEDYQSILENSHYRP